MKKFIAWTLVLVLCLGMFAGCAENPVGSTPGTTAGAAENDGLAKAAKYLKALYNTAPVETGVDYERTTVVPVGKVKYTVTWAVDVAEDLVKIVAGENNTVTIDVNEDNQTETPYKLTATVTDADGNKKEVVFDHILPKAVAKDGTEFTVLEIIEMGGAKEHNTYTDYKYKVTGVITEVYNTQYGNMKITDDAGNILTIYGTFSADGSLRYDAMEVKPVAGDTVTIYGIVGQYNGTPQIKNGWIVAHTPGEGPVDPPAPPADEPAADSTLSVKDAIALGTGKAHDTYTVGKYYVSGVITEVYNTQYGNMKIKDAEGNILTIYGTYSADGSLRYDAMPTKPVAGDTVTIYGIIGQYNGTPQIKNGWITKHTPAGGNTTEPQPTTPVTPPASDPAADSTLSVKDAIALGTSKEHNVYTTGKYYVTGTITEIYNTQYGNMKITDASGNILTIYGTYSADGSTRFDSMSTKPVVGDEVTIYGVIGQYNGTPQIKNGWIVKINGETPSNDPVTPPAPPASNLSIADTLEVGKAYKFGMVQQNAGKTVYLAGGMSGYYMATTEDASAALDVFVEEANGGYYLYAMISGTKTYINMVISTTHVNGAYETTAKTVYTWDANAKTLVATMQPDGKDAEPYWFGTRSDNTYLTVGPCAVSYNGFYCQFYA